MPCRELSRSITSFFTRLPYQATAAAAATPYQVAAALVTHQAEGIPTGATFRIQTQVLARRRLIVGSRVGFRLILRGHHFLLRWRRRRWFLFRRRRWGSDQVHFLNDLGLLHLGRAQEAADEQHAAQEHGHHHGADNDRPNGAFFALGRHGVAAARGDYFTIRWVTRPNWVISSRPIRSNTSTTFWYWMFESALMMTGRLGLAALYWRSVFSSSLMVTGKVSR